MEQLPDLPALVPGLGVFGLLGWLLIRVMRQSGTDRSDYRKAIAELTQQHGVEIAELRQQQAAEIADLRGQVAALRKEVADLRGEVETERRARWRAEDAAARYRRQLGLAEEANG